MTRKSDHTNAGFGANGFYLKVWFNYVAEWPQSQVKTAFMCDLFVRSLRGAAQAPRVIQGAKGAPNKETVKVTGDFLPFQGKQSRVFKL